MGSKKVDVDCRTRKSWEMLKVTVAKFLRLEGLLSLAQFTRASSEETEATNSTKRVAT